MPDCKGGVCRGWGHRNCKGGKSVELCRKKAGRKTIMGGGEKGTTVVPGSGEGSGTLARDEKKHTVVRKGRLQQNLSVSLEPGRGGNDKHRNLSKEGLEGGGIACLKRKEQMQSMKNLKRKTLKGWGFLERSLGLLELERIGNRTTGKLPQLRRKCGSREELHDGVLEEKPKRRCLELHG